VSKLKPPRYIVDTTLRDGEQSPGLAMSIEQKLEIARLLDEAGVYQIEAGIPAMGRMEIETISRIMQNRKNSKISAWNRLRLDDIRKSMDCAPDIIHMSVPVSYVLIYSKLNKNKTWVTKNLVTCVEYALSGGYEVTVGFEDASRADITFMIVLAKQLKDMGVNRIRFADTVGVLSPSRTYSAIRDIVENTGIEVEMHAHNDLGMAVANSIVAAKAGSNYIDTTIFGIGERAGNCDFLKFVHAASGMYDLGISEQSAAVVQQKALSLLAKQLALCV
jgi:homocitrate synthase NifV